MKDEECCRKGMLILVYGSLKSNRADVESLVALLLAMEQPCCFPLLPHRGAAAASQSAFATADETGRGSVEFYGNFHLARSRTPARPFHWFAFHK